MASQRHSAADMAHLQSIHDAAAALGAVCGSADEPAAKAGARHSASDQADMQAMHDTACRQGATCEGAPAESDAPAGKSYAVKSLGGGRVGGYAVLFGDERSTDLAGDFFHKGTDYYLDTLGPRRPMLYDHGTDEATKSRPVVGVWDTARVDDVGVWLEGQLDLRQRYAEAIKQLVDSGDLALSSDSIAHLVRRTRVGTKACRIDAWPLAGASLTVHPMEPRMLPVSAIKALYDEAGVAIPDELQPEPADGALVAESEDGGATAQGSDDERRQRIIRLQLDILDLD